MIELVTDSMAHRGEAVGRVDGKAHFVWGALPAERIVGEVVHDGGSWARVQLVEVLEPSRERVEPPCPHYAACGGCQWQHSSVTAQMEWKREIVEGQLAHLGGIRDATVRPTVAAGPPYRYRNRMDFRVEDGRPALHRRRSKRLVHLDECRLLHPSLEEVFDRLGDLTGVRTLTLRTGTTTGELLAVVTGRVPDHAPSWGTRLAHRTRQGLRTLSGPPAVHERVAGRTLRITGTTFFQNNTPGAEALVSLVSEALAPSQEDLLVDGFAGGGLFSVTVGQGAGRVIAIELNPTATDDLRHNLDANDREAEVVTGSFERELPELGGIVDLLVVDPPRVGLRAEGVAAILDMMPRVIAYVSCDPASFARDAAVLASHGYTVDWVAPVDLFPQTWHIESVARIVLDLGDGL